MHINMEEKNGVSVCYVQGDIDINSSPEVKKYFEQVTREKKDKIVINFKDVNYVDSSGLATLVDVLKKMRAYGGVLKLSNLSEKVMGLFEITKLNKLFVIVQEEADALSSF